MKYRFSVCSACLMVVAACSGQQSSGEPPYAPSALIQDIDWAPASTIERRARGSDNWPLTWADDDNLYTAYGDGHGFEPAVPEKLSLGFAGISGPPESFSAQNIRSGTGEQLGDGPRGKKASGMLMVNGVLYLWARNANRAGEQCQLAWSHDRAQSWDWSEWTFRELGYCVFLNFGRNYAGARDRFVYTYSPDHPSAYESTDHAVLLRVPRDRLTERAAYEVFAGFDEHDRPLWDAELARRAPVFSFPGGVNRLDVTYNAPLHRYLLLLRNRARGGGRNHFSIYDSAEPWGPWTTVYYTEEWDGRALSTGNGGWGESQHFPSKWISADGASLYLVFSGEDAFSVRRARLTVAAAQPRP